MTTTYYNFQIWNGTEQELFSYDLFENIDDLCDEVEEVIYEYTGEKIKSDRYDLKRSMTPCDTYIYHTSPTGYSFIINMLQVKTKAKIESRRKLSNLR